MAVNLVKGQKVNLRKEDGSALTNVMVGLGWSAASEGFFSKLFGSARDIDIDSSVFCCKNSFLTDSDDIIYYHNLRHKSGAIRHMGDDLTGGGDVNADNEQIFIHLDKLPKDYDKLVFVVNIYQAREREQHFGMVKNAFIRVVDNDTKKEIIRYNLSDSYDDMTALIVGEVYRKDGEWKFNAIGQATKDNSIGDLSKRYRA